MEVRLIALTFDFLTSAKCKCIYVCKCKRCEKRYDCVVLLYIEIRRKYILSIKNNIYIIYIQHTSHSKHTSVATLILNRLMFSCDFNRHTYCEYPARYCYSRTRSAQSKNGCLLQIFIFSCNSNLSIAFEKKYWAVFNTCDVSTRKPNFWAILRQFRIYKARVSIQVITF